MLLVSKKYGIRNYFNNLQDYNLIYDLENMKTSELPKKEYSQLIADIKNKVTWGTANYQEKNILNIHNKKQLKNGNNK